MAAMPDSPFDLLLPTPREAVIDGPSFRLDPGRVLRGIGESSEAWQALTKPEPALPSEGYLLRLAEAPTGPQAILAAADERGLRHADTTLAALLDLGDGMVPTARILDWPELSLRGTIEGFYGTPWSHADRLAQLAFAESCKLNSYFYAPKDDPWHRERWREPYPDAELARLAELVDAAGRHGIRLVYCLAPGLSVRYSSEEDHAALIAKADRLWRIGVRDFALLFDDVPTELEHPDDVAVFGAEPGSSGTAQGALCARFQTDFLAPRGVTTPLLVAPTDYAGMDESPYRERLASALPADALLFWTGSDVVVGEVTGDQVRAAARSYRRDLVLWDNYPVNDFDFARAFLGPLQGRDPALRHALRGIVANPMVMAAPSRFALASAADWAWNPAGYDERASAERALHLVAGERAERWRPLVAVLSSWPPSAPEDAVLQPLAERALDDREEDVRRELRERLESLGAAAEALRAEEGDLADQARPWIVAAAVSARAGLAALDLLEGTQDPTDAAAGVEAFLREVEAQPANVLRGVLVPFLRAALGDDADESAQWGAGQ